MSWTDRFSWITVEASDSAELEAHLGAVIDGRAAAPPPPAFTDEPVERDVAARAWQDRVRHGELLAVLGLRERSAGITIVQFASESRAMVSARGEPLLLSATSTSMLDSPELLDALVGRELIVVGDAGSLWQWFEGLGDRKAQLRVIQALVERVPSMPATARLLQRSYGCPVGEALADPRGGWLAITPSFGELLVLVRKQERLVVWGRTGDAVEAGGWGLLGCESDDQPIMLDVWARLLSNRDDQPAIQLGVPETRLDSSDGLELGIQDLHSLLGTLPVFAYRLCLRDDASRLVISPLPGVDVDEVRTAVSDATARGLDDLVIELVEPGVEFQGPIVDDVRVADFASLVQVVWSGPPDSDLRRAAWRVALISAGATGSGSVRLIDGASGAELSTDAHGTVDPLAIEVFERLKLPPPPGVDALVEPPEDRIIVVGEPGPGVEGNGWVMLVEPDRDRDGVVFGGGDRNAVARIAALLETGVSTPELGELTVNGIHMQPYSRPTLAAPRVGDDGQPFYLHAERCTGAGDCMRVCPTKAITLVELRPVIDAELCVRCQLCNERCEQAALRPFLDTNAYVDGRSLVRDAARLGKVRDRVRPRTLEGKLVEPPPQLDPRKAPATVRRKPTVVLGLATVTLMEHAAALLVDGQLVAGVEEERLARVRHYSFVHPERPGASLSSEPCIRLEDAWPQRSIDAVLKIAGLSMDDVDLVAINGIPARLIHSFSGGGGWRPPPVMRANSIAYVPHHMSHAASVYGLSGFSDAWILSIDGRGDYETATVWRAEGHELEIIDAVPFRPDRSFGGVYETATRALGFGTHGQGSTMALAALGEPCIDVSDCIGTDADGVPVLSEWAAEKRFGPYTRNYDDELADEHKNLAASVQLALETTVGEYLARHVGSLRGQNLGMCGGVALNCRMNGTLRARFEPAQMHVPPGANDAGTAIGAAIIGHRELTGELPRLDLGHTHLGPAWSDESIAKLLERMRVPFQRLRNVGAQTAELLADGRIVCWFQGPMEYGPRALGGRSIIADPRREAIKSRLNAMKSRQDWRPFGPSVLAGRQSDWFTHDWDSRFMLFAVDVKPEKRAEIPVVVHFDGSTRPQVVHREHHPRYHDLISAFEKRTGVPMVVNTSFNRGGEPIVCNPVEALRSFAGLGADAIVLGDCLVRRELLRRR